jgi:hypothetical protein
MTIYSENIQQAGRPESPSSTCSVPHIAPATQIWPQEADKGRVSRIGRLETEEPVKVIRNIAILVALFCAASGTAEASTVSRYVSVVKGSAHDGSLSTLISNDQGGGNYGWFWVHGTAKLYNRAFRTKHVYLHWGMYAAVCDFDQYSFDCGPGYHYWAKTWRGDTATVKVPARSTVKVGWWKQVDLPWFGCSGSYGCGEDDFAYGTVMVAP